MKKIIGNMKIHYDYVKVLSKYSILDKINILQNELILLICILFIFLYYNSVFSSVRNIVSDTVSLSSIILGILGVLIGILISLKENSDFFKKAVSLEKEGFFFGSLIKKMKNAFLLNMFFVVLTISSNLLLPSTISLLKYVAIFGWFFLLVKVLWQVCYLITTITKIATYKVPEYDKPAKKA